MRRARTGANLCLFLVAAGSFLALCQAMCVREGVAQGAGLSQWEQTEPESGVRRSLIADESGSWHINYGSENKEDTHFFRSLCNTKYNGDWDKVAVVAGTRYEATWLEAIGLDSIRYQSENTSDALYFFPTANEGGAYLQFIIDFYYCLPNHTLFLHGHRDSWHSVDMEQTVKNLKWDKVPGYADLNRVSTRQLPMASRPRYPNVPPIATGEEVYNGQFRTHQIFDGKAYPAWEAHEHLLLEAYARAYDQFFGPHGFGAMPDVIQHVCCAQFAVTREAIQIRPRIFYVEALRYIMPQINDLRANHIHNRVYVVGDMLTVMWPMIFGMPAMYEPLPSCDLFDTC